MVIVRIIGGLGNQLFQYATGRSLAYLHNVPLKLDISGFASYPLRSFRLNKFNVSSSIASPHEVNNLAGKMFGFLPVRVTRRLQSYLPYPLRSVILEQQHCYDPRLLFSSRHVYLSGYWQSERYFKCIEPLLRQEFTLKSSPAFINQITAQKMVDIESVSLHVRRGDYVSDRQTFKTLGVCSIDYYKAAIAQLVKTVQEPHFFLFSDDLNWVRENLYLEYPATYIDQNGPESDYEDLWLMSQCKHHIIANSSFSWWGAWLSNNPRKQVFAPANWFNSPELDARDLIPDAWHKIAH